MDAKIDGQNLSYLEHLSTEELEEILRQDLLSDEDSGLEPEYIMAVMEVIDRRSADKLDHPADVDAAWQDFQENYMGRSALYEATYLCDQPSDLQQDGKAKRRRTVRIALYVAAAVAIIATLLSVPAFGRESLIQILVARCTQGQFTLQPDDGPPDGPTEQLETVPEEYADFRSALAEEGIELITIPRYIPEGFQVTEQSLEISPTTGTLWFHIRYQKDDLVLIFEAKELNGVILQHEKDSGDAVPYPCGGVVHYLFTNESDTNTVVWYIDRMHYTLVTDLAAAEIENIIDSMY